MSRRRGSSIGFDMFPFLSVLCSVIGVLMLFILLIVSSRVMAETAPPQIPPAPPPPPPRELAPRPSGIAEDEYERLATEIRRMAAHLTARQKEAQVLKNDIGKLEDLIAAKEDEQLVPEYGKDRLLGVQVEKPVDVYFDEVENVRVTKTPIFVEVSADKLIVHPEKREYGIDQLKGPRSDLQAYLAAVDRQRKNEYLLLLIHSNGVETYEKFTEFLREKYPHPAAPALSRIDTGAEPFSDGWLLISEQLAKKRNQ